MMTVASSAALARLSFGPLPSAQELEALIARGVRYCLNLSGVLPADIYPAHLSRMLSVESLRIADHFSGAADLLRFDLSSVIPPSVEELVDVMGVRDAQAFCTGVHWVVRCLRDSAAGVHLYCHRGRGRSVAATLACVCVLLDVPPLAAARLFARRWPQTPLSARMIAAAELVRERASDFAPSAALGTGMAP